MFKVKNFKKKSLKYLTHASCRQFFASYFVVFNSFFPRHNCLLIGLQNSTIGIVSL